MPALHAHVHCKCDKYCALASVACNRAHVWAFLVFCRLPGNRHMLFVAPEPCGAVPVAADCKEAVADCKLHMAKSKPGIADCMWHLPIRNCQVLCIFLCACGLQPVDMHTGGGGILVEIKPNTIAENFTTQRHSQR